MSSAAEAAADSAAYLDELTGARQTWIEQCRRALAPDGGTADWAPLTDENGAWARALRTGRELPDPDDELALRPEIADVNAAHAIRTLARHLAGRDPIDPATAAAPLLRHCDTAHLVSIGTGSFEPLRWLVNSAWTPHRDRLRALVDHLAETGHPAAGFAALLACHLTDALPDAGTPATVRVLYDRDSSVTADDAGTTGRLTLRVLPGGPPGLHPDPARMAFFTSVDERFTASATNAWASSDLATAAPPVCVVWNLTIDGRNPAPANDVDGGSLGAAYAIALHELNELHRRDQRWTRHVPVLRQLDFRRHLTNPYAAATGTVVDQTGALGPVSGLDHKLEAARRAGISLVITAPGTPHDGRQPEPRLATVATTRQAVEQAHTHRNRSFRITVTRVIALAMVVALLASTAIYLGFLGRSLAQEAATQARVAASDRLLNEAVPMLPNRPREALQLLEAAMTLNPTSTAVRAALVNGLATTHYAGTIDDPSGGVQAVAVSPDGKTLVNGSATAEGAGRLSLWSFSPPAPAAPAGNADTKAPIRVLTFTDDSRTLYSGEAGGALTVWNVSDPGHPKIRQTLHDHTDHVQEITVAPGGKIVATASTDGTIVLYRRSESGALKRVQTLPKETGGVFCVAFSPDAAQLFTGNLKGQIIIWKIDDLERPVRMETLQAHNDLVRSITVGKGGRFVASASFDATINIWDLTTGKPTLRESLDGRGKVFQAVFAPDGHTLVAGSYNRTALLWNIPDRGPARPLATLAGHDGYVRAVAFTPDNRHVVTGSLDHSMMVWNVATAGQPSRLKTVVDRSTAVRALAFSPDQQTLAVAGGGGAVHLYNADDVKSDDARVPKPRRILSGPVAEISDLVYSPDGRWLAAADWHGNIQLWDASSDGPPEPQVLAGPKTPLYSVAFNRAGTLLAAGAESKEVALWDVSDPVRAREVSRWRAHDEPVQAVAFDPADPNRMATGSLDKTVKLWDIGNPAQPKPLTTLTGHDEAVLTAGYSPDGSMLASGSVDATTSLWTRPETPHRTRATLTGHSLGVRTHTFTPDGLLITGSDDGTATIYSLTDPSRPVPLGATRANQPDEGPTLNQSVLDTAYSGDVLATSTRAGTFTLFNLAPVDQILTDPKGMACDLTKTGLTSETWAQLMPDLQYKPSCP